jgi:hypothetical protein
MIHELGGQDERNPPMIRSSIHPAYWTGGNRESHVEVLLLGVEDFLL